MALIFEDTLNVASGSGLYTLQVYGDSSWQDLHTISGVTDGSVYINSTSNIIELDTAVLISGHTYQFRWIDGNGTLSNIRSLTVAGSISLSGSVGTDSDGFPQFEISIGVIGGSGTYELHLINPAGTQVLPVGSDILTSLGVTDFQNFSITAPLPIRGSDYGDTFSFQFADTISSQVSAVISVTQPPLNTDPSKSINLSVASSGGNISVSATVTGGSGEYRLEIRDPTNTPMTDQDFSGVTSGTLSESFSLSSRNLTAGQSYTFLLFDTAQVVSNAVVIVV